MAYFGNSLKLPAGRLAVPVSRAQTFSNLLNTLTRLQGRTLVPKLLSFETATTCGDLFRLPNNAVHFRACKKPALPALKRALASFTHKHNIRGKLVLIARELAPRLGFLAPDREKR